MKKLFALLLALVLTLSLAAPALAWEELDPPLWKGLGFGCREEYLSATNLSVEDYIAQTDWLRAYLADHRSEDAAFDADDYYDNVYMSGHPSTFPKQAWIDDQPPGYTEADFQAGMRAEWLSDLWRRHREEVHREAVVTLYTEDFASFDADAWFAGYFGGTLGVTKEYYMAQEGQVTEDEFRRAMFAESVDGTHSMGGHWAVALNGTPLSFYPRGEIYPTLYAAATVDAPGILWVPARPVAEALGFTVSYAADTGAATFRRADRVAVFTVGSADYTINGAAASLGEDQAYAEGGRLFLPIPQLARALGCTWNWNGAHSAVFLYSNDKD